MASRLPVWRIARVTTGTGSSATEHLVTTRCPTAYLGGSGSLQSAPGATTCALTSAGVAYCWGNQLANGSATSSTTPIAVSGGITFTALSSGGLFHTCGVATTGDAYCWGDNAYGQLGNGTSNGSITPVRVVAQ